MKLQSKPNECPLSFDCLSGADQFVISLMGRVQALRTQGLIKPLPTQIFHASKAEAAFEACLKHPLSSNIALTLDKTAAVVQVCLSTVI